MARSRPLTRIFMPGTGSPALPADRPEAAAPGNDRPGADESPRPPDTLVRLGAAAGVLGPAAFTAAWVAGALRQRGLSFAQAQLSGLAADNARDPWIMITGFLALGACAVPFGWALQAASRRRGPAGPGPALVVAAGAATIATGLLRRDHVLLTAGPQSWHNHAHDVVSAVAYVLLVAAPVLLARQFRAWRGLAALLVMTAAASAALLIVFYAAPHEPWDGLLQRIAVSLPLAALAALAARLLRTV